MFNWSFVSELLFVITLISTPYVVVQLPLLIAYSTVQEIKSGQASKQEFLFAVVTVGRLLILSYFIILAVVVSSSI